MGIAADNHSPDHRIPATDTDCFYAPEGVLRGQEPVTATTGQSFSKTPLISLLSRSYD